MYFFSFLLGFCWAFPLSRVPLESNEKIAHDWGDFSFLLGFCWAFLLSRAPLESKEK